MGDPTISTTVPQADTQAAPLPTQLTPPTSQTSVAPPTLSVQSTPTAQPTTVAPVRPAMQTPTITPGAKVHGVLGGIVIGALHGAASALGATARATGRELQTIGTNSPEGRAIQQQRNANQAATTAQQEAQQRMQIAKKQEERAESQESRAEKEFNARLALINQEQASSAFTYATTHAKALADTANENAAFFAQLGAMGITPDFTKKFSDMTPQDAKNLTNGNYLALAKYESGDDAGLYLFSPRDLFGVPTSQDTKIPTKWTVNKQNDTLEPTEYQTFPAGTDAGQLFMVYSAAHAKGEQEYALYQQGIETQSKVAAAKEAAATGQQRLAAAALSNAQVQQIRSLGGIVPDNYVPDEANFQLSQTQLQSKLAQQGVKVPGNFASLYAIAHYDLDPNTFPARPYNRPGSPYQMSKAEAANAIRTFINPNYQEENYGAVKKLEADFASSSPSSAGGQLTAFNTATLHLGQLYQATKALGNGDLTDLNRLAQDLGVHTGRSAPVVFDAIRDALVGEIGKTFKGGSPDIPERDSLEKTLQNENSPEQLLGTEQQYAHLMLSKSASVLQPYVALTGYLPPRNIDPAAQQIYQEMGIDWRAQLPNAQVRVGGTANQNAGQTPQQSQGTPIYLNGKLLGYSSDGGKTYTPVK